MGIGNDMAAKRIVTEAQAEINTFKHAQLIADILPAGAEKAQKQQLANDFKGRVNTRRGR